MAKETRSDLYRYAKMCGLVVRTYSPGDGVTRYRFFTDPNSDFFGPSNGIHTALGLKQALAFVSGYQAATGKGGY